MANDEHVAMLKQGVDAWNKWRNETPDIRPDLRGAHLTGADLINAHLRAANLSRAALMGALLSGANLSGADLSGADLHGAQLIQTDLCNATLTGTSVYGASVWSIKVDEHTKQRNLIITDYDEPVITVDDIEVAPKKILEFSGYFSLRRRLGDHRVREVNRYSYLYL